MKKLILIFIALTLLVSISGSQWFQVSNGLGTNRYIYTLAAGGSNLFAGASTGGVFLSTNNGESWVQTSLTAPVIQSLLVNGNTVFAGTSISGVYLSTNNGSSWIQTPLNNHTINALAVKGNTVFAGSDSTGVYKTTNNGASWVAAGLTGTTVYSLAEGGGLILAGLNNFGVRVSTDEGISWITTVINNTTVFDFAHNGSTVFAGTFNGGVYKSTNYGLNWVQSAFNEELTGTLSVSGNNVFAGTFASGVFVSTDNGISWTQRNEGLTINNAECSAILNNYIFIGGQHSVFRRPLSELIGIQQISHEAPDSFSLTQNYPNPFNPVTNINFQLSKSAFVRLTVFDMLGKEVEVLVNEELRAGTYNTDWNASNYASGVYFYRLEAGDFSDIRKMVLVK